VFEGEGYTDKNVRFCVNSISLDFVPEEAVVDTQKAYFAGGCFWGVEYLMEQEDGVFSVKSGYMGGTKPNPTYQDVCSGKYGYAETV
jgi:peptide methionine sulfoxide reductase msrA/msrB